MVHINGQTGSSEQIRIISDCVNKEADTKLPMGPGFSTVSYARPLVECKDAASSVDRVGRSKGVR